MMLIRWVFQTF